jgi:hypothetical protein
MAIRRRLNPRLTIYGLEFLDQAECSRRISEFVVIPILNLFASLLNPSLAELVTQRSLLTHRLPNSGKTPHLGSRIWSPFFTALALACSFLVVLVAHLGEDACIFIKNCCVVFLIDILGALFVVAYGLGGVLHLVLTCVTAQAVLANVIACLIPSTITALVLAS